MHDPKHCKFGIIRSTVTIIESGTRWVERCPCGLTVMIECLFNIGESKIPQQRRTWFDREGKIRRITGNNDRISSTPSNHVDKSTIENDVKG